jgi:hypothetical protein
MAWKKNACYEGETQGMDWRDAKMVRDKLACVEREHHVVLRERDQLRRQLDDMMVKNLAFEERVTHEYDNLLREFEDVQRIRFELKRENDAFKRESDALKRENDAFKREIDALRKENDKLKKHTSTNVSKVDKMPSATHVGIAVDNTVYATPVVSENVVEKTTKHHKAKKSVVKQSVPRVFNVNNEDDIDYIMKMCCGDGVAKCILSDAYVNKNYTHTIHNNGYHKGVNNTCLALSLSDGLARILHGRPANNQEKDEMIKALGCKGRMMDVSDLDVLVAIFNKISNPHKINIHVFERLENGRHTHCQSIAHGVNASTKDRCIVLSWVKDAHFELLLR